MFSGIKRLLGNITVDEIGTEVRVEGVDTRVMTSHIRARFNSSRIEKHMFSRLDNSSFSFPSFFLPDVAHMFELMSGMRSLQMPSRTLSKIHELLMTDTWLAKTREEPYSKLDYTRLSGLTLTPKTFQTNFFEAYDKLTGQYGLTGFLLAGAAGSGKTFSSLALTYMLDSDHVIVSCPKNAVETVWKASILGTEKEPSKFKDIPTAWFAHEGKPYNGEKFIVGHYEALEQLLEVAKQLQGKNVAVILDESHNLNNDKSLRTQRFIDLCKIVDSQDVIWLSGTPIKALAIEAIPLLRCIDPLFTEDVEARFRKIYNDNKGKATDILQLRMGLISFIVRKEELGLEKPDFQTIKVKVTNGQRYTLTEVKKAMQAFITERDAYYKARFKTDKSLYDKGIALFEQTLRSKADHTAFEDYLRAFRTVVKTRGDWAAKDEMALCNRYEISTILPTLPKEMRNEWKSVRALIKYPHLKIQGECLGRIVGGLRVQCHVDMAGAIDYRAVCESSVKKTVVFSSFVAVLDRCAEVMPSQGLNPLFVSAKTNKNLSQIVRDFGAEEDVNPLAATYASLSTAVPLVMADNMLLIDTPFRDYVLQQAVSRINRLGADTQAKVYTAQLDTGEEPNLSTRSTDILKWSQEQVAAITGVRSPFEIKDDLAEFSAALEGFDQPVLLSVKDLPKYLGW